MAGEGGAVANQVLTAQLRDVQLARLNLLRHMRAKLLNYLFASPVNAGLERILPLGWSGDEDCTDRDPFDEVLSLQNARQAVTFLGAWN